MEHLFHTERRRVVRHVEGGVAAFSHNPVYERHPNLPGQGQLGPHHIGKPQQRIRLSLGRLQRCGHLIVLTEALQVAQLNGDDISLHQGAERVQSILASPLFEGDQSIEDVVVLIEKRPGKSPHNDARLEGGQLSPRAV